MSSLAVEVDRNTRWIDGSIAASAVETFMMPIVQGLGQLDVALISEDARFSGLQEREASSLHESCLLTNRFTLSYLWVLGAYELVRALDQRCRAKPDTMPAPFRDRLAALKRTVERLRIPLAKMEPARRHPTDSPIAYPALSRDFGVAWQIASDAYITRRELSDGLLNFLTDLKALPAAPDT